MKCLLLLCILGWTAAKNLNGAIQPKLIGTDTNTATRSFLYEAGILYKDNKGIIKICTGAIINPLWILTSASCASNSINMRVGFGKDIDLTEWQGAIVEKRIIHPGYVPTSLANDIALLKLLDFNAATGDVVEIAPVADKFIGKVGLVSGYGALNNGKDAGTLREIFSGIQSSAFCNKVGIPINANQFCIYPSLTCEGDQGSPLVVDSKLVGLVTMTDSFASLCGILFPSTYTYVAPYRQWITATTGIKII